MVFHKWNAWLPLGYTQDRGKHERQNKSCIDHLSDRSAAVNKTLTMLKLEP